MFHNRDYCMSNERISSEKSGCYKVGSFNHTIHSGFFYSEIAGDNICEHRISN